MSLDPGVRVEDCVCQSFWSFTTAKIGISVRDSKFGRIRMTIGIIACTGSRPKARLGNEECIMNYRVG